MSLSWTSILETLFSVIPDIVKEWLKNRREAKEKKAQNDANLKDAIASGDPDRIAAARRLRDQG